MHPLPTATRLPVRADTSLYGSMIRTLLYYDIFHYPLTADEVYRFLDTHHHPPTAVVQALQELVAQGYVHHHHGFFGLHPHDRFVKRRIAGNALAKQHMPLARKRANLIFRFPFVRGVMASGSFSKGYMDAHSDLDFFIITAPHRLWIARMMIVMFKRLFFFNRHTYFCCNYFISSDHLEIEEKNLFTATELATLIPLANHSLYHKLMQANPWVKVYYPNHTSPTSNTQALRTGWPKFLLEWSLSNQLGNWLDRRFMQITGLRWKRLYQKKYTNHDFANAFKTNRHASKNHPRLYQNKVLKRFEQKINWFYSHHRMYRTPALQKEV